MKTLSILCALALPCSAQIFDWSFETTLQHGPATVSGQITIDPNANTASLSGVIESPVHDWQYNLSQNTPIPGTFPRVEWSAIVASITLHIPEVSLAFDVPPAVPTGYWGSVFQTPYPNQSLAINVGYSYTLLENGVEFASGSGSYLVRGRPTTVYIDASSYPLAVAVGTDGAGFYPVSQEPMYDETSPMGIRTTTMNPLIVLGVIPEPSTYGIAFAATLFGLAIYRQSSRNTKKVLH